MENAEINFGFFKIVKEELGNYGLLTMEGERLLSFEYKLIYPAGKGFIIRREEGYGYIEYPERGIMEEGEDYVCYLPQRRVAKSFIPLEYDRIDIKENGLQLFKSVEYDYITQTRDKELYLWYDYSSAQLYGGFRHLKELGDYDLFTTGGDEDFYALRKRGETVSVYVDREADIIAKLPHARDVFLCIREEAPDTDGEGPLYTYQLLSVDAGMEIEYSCRYATKEELSRDFYNGLIR